MRWNTSPIAFELAGAAVPYYTLFFLLGAALAYFTGQFLSKRGALAHEHVNALAWRLVVGILIGAHLAHLIFYEPASFIERPIRIVELGVGLASHGGALGAWWVIWRYCRKHTLDPWRVLDLCSVAALWLAPTIRVGNFFNSEIIGTPTNLPWGIVFTGAGYPQPHHPAQLYEAVIGCILIALILPWYAHRWKTTPAGRFFFAVIGAYFATRFLVEFVKDDWLLQTGFPFTMGQVLSLLWLSMTTIAAHKHHRYNASSSTQKLA